MNILELYSAAAPYITSIFVGVMLSLLFWFGKNKFFRGKIICIMHTRDGDIENVLLRPNENSMLQWTDKGNDRGAYIYNADLIKRGSFLTQRLPTLTYIEGTPAPVVINTKGIEVVGVTAKELSADFSDKISRDLVAATSDGEAALGNKKLQQVMVIGMALLGLFMIAVAYLVISKSNAIMNTLSGAGGGT